MAIERSLLQQVIAKGWKPTAAGKALLAGRLPAPYHAIDGTIQIGAQLAIAPVGANAAAVVARLRARGLQSTRRIMSSYVFLYCGIGQRANVNFYEAAGNYAWVSWEEHNFQTGAVQNIRSAATYYCPSNSGGCLEYFSIKPPSPWFVWAATEAVVTSPLNEYCGG